jgi:hypothetical protein
MTDQRTTENTPHDLLGDTSPGTELAIRNALATATSLATDLFAAVEGMKAEWQTFTAHARKMREEEGYEGYGYSFTVHPGDHAAYVNALAAASTAHSRLAMALRVEVVHDEDERDRAAALAAITWKPAGSEPIAPCDVVAPVTTPSGAFAHLSGYRHDLRDQLDDVTGQALLDFHTGDHRDRAGELDHIHAGHTATPEQAPEQAEAVDGEVA